MRLAKKKPSFRRRFTRWVCDRLWPQIDSQEQLFHLQLDITNACNLRCRHCYCPHHKNDGALSFEQWCQVLDRYDDLLDNLHMKPVVTLCGGEPMVSPFVVPLLKEIRMRFPHCDLSVQTNGTLFSSEHIRLFQGLRVNCQISFDGPDAARHDVVRGDGSFEKSMNGCRMLADGGVDFILQAVLSHRTKEWIGEFFELAKDVGASAMNFTRLIQAGHAIELIESNVDSPIMGGDLRHAYENILTSSSKFQLPTSTNGALWFLIDGAESAPNNIGFNGLVIGYQGEIKVSSRTSAVIGHALRDDWTDVFMNHPTMVRLRKGDIDGCGTCQHFLKCRGERNISFAEFGHFFGPDTGCWVRS